jgi:DNA-binding MarR family transcriptional regulator
MTSPTTMDDREPDHEASFTAGEYDAMLNVVRTAAALLDQLDGLLRPYGIGTTQYNVLRILRIAEPDGFCRNALRDRMLSRMPDMTRLLDRMEEMGLVTRERDDEDRRMVTTRITDAGRRLVDELEGPVIELYQGRFGRLSPDEVGTLTQLLRRVREGG